MLTPERISELRAQAAEADELDPWVLIDPTTVLALCAEIERLRSELETLRIQHGAWTDAFGTTQLTHALAGVGRSARISPERSEVAKLAHMIAQAGWTGRDQNIGLTKAYKIIDHLIRYVCGAGGTEPPARISPERAREILESPELLERLADQEHERWSGWIRYQGLAPIERRRDWARKAATPYAQLTDAEQESDRIEARKTIAVLLSALCGAGGTEGEKP